MNPIDLARHAGSNPWMFLGAALVLGVLHGLEPGHSKGIMAAFMVGARGTYTQAVVLALCATLSHTLIVWVLAVPASYSGVFWSEAQVAPYLNLVSGVVVLVLAAWMWSRFRRARHHAHDPAHDHGDGHSHDNGHEHDHAHSVSDSEALTAVLDDEDDAHARHHMRAVAERFAGQPVSTGQVALFGLGTGLAPCTAAVVILVTCFRLHQPWLGLALVGAFSIGLGLTLTSVVLLASWGVRTVGARSKGFHELVRRAPLVSALVTACIGVYLIAEFFLSR